MKPLKDFGLLKEMAKDVREIKRRLITVEKAVQIEKLTKDDLREIRLSEGEIKKGKYKTLEQVKKELGIE